MCWNKEVSLISFVIGMIGVFYLYHRNLPNDRWIAIFGGTIIMIQLAEFLMWSDQNCGELNKIASILALIILIMEPLSNMIGGAYFSETSKKKYLKYGILVYLLFITTIYFVEYRNKKIEWCGLQKCITDDSQNKGCHLSWKFMNSFSGTTLMIWTLFLSLPFFAMEPIYHGLIIFLLGLSTLIFSLKYKTSVAGSLWCWYGIIIIFAKIMIK